MGGIIIRSRVPGPWGAGRYGNLQYQRTCLCIPASDLKSPVYSSFWYSSYSGLSILDNHRQVIFIDVKLKSTLYSDKVYKS